MNSFNYNSPILGQMRSGTGNDPYIPYNNVTFKVINGKVQLTEIPDEFHRVQVTEGSTYYNEVIQTVPTNLQFSVDYNLGLISFHASAEGKTLSITYYGRGALFFPADRVWTKAENGNVAETLSTIIEAGQEAIIAIPELLETIAESEQATNAANTAAAYANLKGDYAKTQGEYALAKGNDANTAASAANTTNTAVQAAEAIRVASEITRVNQESARVNAEASRVAVESDRVNAEASRVTAELARVSAEISRVNVEASRVNKELARVAAETARDEAEVIRLASEAARVNEENARLSAETTRLTNESNRVAQELARVSAETNRVTVELVRVAAETSRATVEANRVTSESERVNAETSRVDAESARVAEELLRVGVETSRVNAELARVNEEASRVTAELVRVNAESIRISAEQDRLDTEVLRDSYESTRENNEITRISNETARALAEDSRNNTEDNRVLSETNRESAENVRQDGYEAFMLLEDYNNAHSYVPLNKVVYIGSTYQCILATTGNLPTDTAYWIKIAQRGLDGAGTVTDITSPNSDIAIGGTPDHPTIIANSGTTANKLLKLDSNAEFPATLVKQDSSHRMISDSKITEWDGKQDALGFTPASLDNNGKIPISQIPDDVITSLDWNDITNKPTSTVVEIDEAVVKVNDIGDKANLQTSVKTDLVSAINEINASAGGKLVMLKNTVNVTTASSSVNIGIPSFSKDSDMIMVYENSVYIEKDIDYTISNDSLQLLKTGNWIVGTHLNIVIFKNISTTVSMIDGSQIEDGSIKDIKLHSENKIGKLTNLLTTNKTSVVSAINELFQSGSEFKGDVAAAITAKGRPTAANDPKQVFIDNINSITTATGNALPSDVLAPKTFTNSSGEQVGTITTYDGISVDPSATSYVPLPDAYYKNLVVKQVIFDRANVLQGTYILGVNGTMTNFGVIGDITPYTADIPISAGYQGGLTIKGDADLVSGNIKDGVDIFGVVGTLVPASGNVVASNVLFGRTFTNDSGAHTGTMPNWDEVGPDIYPNNVDNILAAGFYGGLNIKATTFDASKVLEGTIIANKNGTMTNRGGPVFNPSTTTQVISEGYYDGSGYVKGDPALRGANIAAGKQIFGVNGTYDCAIIPLAANTGRFDEGNDVVRFNFDFKPNAQAGWVKSLGFSLSFGDILINPSNAVNPSLWYFRDSAPATHTLTVDSGTTRFEFYIVVGNWNNNTISGSMWCKQTMGASVNISALNPSAKTPNMNFIYMRN